MNKLATLSAITALSFSSLMADNHEQSMKFSAQEVSPGIHMLMGVGGFTGGNVGVLVGSDGVIMIDDAMPSSLEILQQAIVSVTDRPIDYLINTHVHGDHTGNNVTFKQQGAAIVAHENLRQHLLNKGIPKGKEMVQAPKDMLPVITFASSMTFHLNGQDAALVHLPHAHTDGDAIIHFSPANVIHTGDIFFNGMFPFIDVNSGGSAQGYLAAQKAILERSDAKTQIIPGHGPLAKKADLAAAVSMLEDSIEIVERLIAAGKTEDEVVKLNPLSKYHDKWNWGFITTERMTRQLYKSLSHNNQHAHNDTPHHH
ncbi:MAG: MBL fold metallo-hydrolase [Gammaproteobacteria bacterium]|nr:MBL fold metallo-hydrolase [Gammaproteobacteria bacterium]